MKKQNKKVASDQIVKITGLEADGFIAAILSFRSTASKIGQIYILKPDNVFQFFF